MNKIKLNTRNLSVESESEYFFDDQFSVPFDANLKEENNNIRNDMSISNINDISQLCQSFSESCIYSDLDSSYQVFPDVLEDYIGGRFVKQENFIKDIDDEEMNINDSITKSSTSQSSIFKDLLIKQSSRDYCITFEEKSNSPLTRQMFPSFQNSSNSFNETDDTTDRTKVTWHQISKKNQNSLLRSNPVAKERLGSKENSSTTWRQLKDNASNKTMSWNKLKNPSKPGEQPSALANQDGPTAVMFQKSVMDPEPVTSASNNAVMCRGSREPGYACHRFSGTLFEIYSRSRGLTMLQSKSSHELFDPSSQKSIELPPRAKILFNFGAQFPPPGNGADFFHCPQKSITFSSGRRVQHYPKLGLVKTPKSSRLAHSAFLSRTLPDLSFLNASEDAKRPRCSNIPKMCDSEHITAAPSKALRDVNQLCSKCSASSFDIAVVDDLIILDDDKAEAAEKSLCSNRFASVPDFHAVDLLTGSPLNRNKAKNRPADSSESETPLKSCLRPSLDRSVSEPDFNNSSLSDNTKYSNFEGPKNRESLTSSTSDMDGAKSNKPKKSVSFSEKKLGSSLSPKKYYGSSISLGRSGGKCSLKPQEIPRDWGLYGGSGSSNTMVSEFVLGAPCKSLAICENECANDNIKYKVMIQDIIATIKDIVVTGSDRYRKLNENKAIKAHLFVVEPLYELLTDGLLPYQKNVISTKSRYRLWNVIESSSSNVDEYMIEILKSVKKVPITNEKKRFKLFISLLLDAKLLQKWLRNLVNSEILLKSNYCKDSFLRQATNKLKGLYNDLETNLQSLDNSSSFEDWSKLPVPAASQTASEVSTQSVLSCGIGGGGVGGSVSGIGIDTRGEKSVTRLQQLMFIGKNSARKPNPIQSTGSSLNKSQEEMKKFKSLRCPTESEVKSVTKSIVRSNSKVSGSANSTSFSSSIPDLKKPIIYYPRYQVGKGKL